MTNEQLKLMVLEATGLPAIPEPIEKKETRVWVKAVARIRKRNGNEGFAIVVNACGGTPRLVKVFDDYGVSEILDVRPYEWLADKYAKKIEAMTESADIKAFVSAAYAIPADRLRSTSTEKAKCLAYNYCIQKQLEKKE